MMATGAAVEDGFSLLVTVSRHVNEMTGEKSILGRANSQSKGLGRQEHLDCV